MQKSNCTKKRDAIHQRIGRLKEKCQRVSAHYQNQAVQLIRRKLQERGIHESWASLRETLGQQSRITATFKQRDGNTLHIRQATRPEEELAHLYTNLGISPAPGGLQRLSI